MYQTLTLGELVSKSPSLKKIFNNKGIDYCCKGYRTLEIASKEDQFNLDDMITVIKETMHQSSTIDLTMDSNFETLIERILNKHHRYLNEQLPIISEYVKTILRVHGQNHPELLKLYQDFHALKNELELHMIKEETIQYPAIETYLSSQQTDDLDTAKAVINDLESEHEAAGDLLKSMRSTTNHFQAPSNACETFVKTYRQLEALEVDMFEHIHLENNILFKKLLAL